MVYGDYNPAYLDGLRNHMKNTHTHILHSQLRATEGNLMLSSVPQRWFFIWEISKFWHKHNIPKNTSLCSFFIDFLCRIPFRRNKILSSAQLSQLFFFNTTSLWDSMSCFHACAGKRYVARLGDAKETKRKGRRSDRNDLRHCETKKGSFVFIAHDFFKSRI